MVYACAIAPLARTEALKSQGFADSKQLTAERRDQLYREMDDDGAILCLVDAISAAHISGKMQGRHKVSLNQIAMDSTVNLIKAALAQGANLQEVYVDTVGDSQTYQAKLSAQFPGVQFTVCPKADALYPIVSAASIAAKVG
jgi:ribonuclease H2 subunit A